jgi:hypothetical protein|mmetsp:Transcript_111814/g.194082  ORF Transcript_111814/g.194082 Transcript_111814/m.194082 type:complete len:324 (-) Transcript_111814:1179-2150(-)
MAELPLENTWTVWKSKWKGTPDLQQHGDFSDVRGFWTEFNRCMASTPPDKSYLHIMKEGIAPMWEDPNNSTGGHFKIIAVTQETSWYVWEAIVLRMIGALFPDNNLINGASIVVHSHGSNLIKLWLSTTNKSLVQMTKATLVSALDPAHYQTDRITFVPHKLVIKGSSQKLMPAIPIDVVKKSPQKADTKKIGFSPSNLQVKTVSDVGSDCGGSISTAASVSSSSEDRFPFVRHAERRYVHDPYNISPTPSGSSSPSPSPGSSRTHSRSGSVDLSNYQVNTPYTIPHAHPLEDRYVAPDVAGYDSADTQWARLGTVMYTGIHL